MCHKNLRRDAILSSAKIRQWDPSDRNGSMQRNDKAAEHFQRDEATATSQRRGSVKTRSKASTCNDEQQGVNATTRSKTAAQRRAATRQRKDVEQQGGSATTTGMAAARQCNDEQYGSSKTTSRKAAAYTTSRQAEAQRRAAGR